MSEVEINAFEWISKINERIVFLLLNIKEHRDISEDDYDILKLLYKQWWLGVHPLFKTQAGLTNETSVQSELFDRLAEAGNKKDNGTSLADTLVEL